MRNLNPTEDPQYDKINDVNFVYRAKNNILEINVILPDFDELEGLEGFELESLLNALKTVFKNDNLRYTALTDNIIRVKGEQK